MLLWTGLLSGSGSKLGGFDSFKPSFKLGGFRVVLNRAGARAAFDGLIGRHEC